MSQPILELGDRLNWNVLVQQTYVATQVSEKNFIPLPPVSVQSTSNIIAAGGRNPKSSVRWQLAAWLHPCLSITPSSTSQFVSLTQLGRHAVPLDRLGLIHFPHYEPIPYLLYITFPRWHQELSLEVWSYDGPESTTTEASLARIESQLSGP